MLLVSEPVGRARLRYSGRSAPIVQTRSFHNMRSAPLKKTRKVGGSTSGCRSRRKAPAP